MSQSTPDRTDSRRTELSESDQHLLLAVERRRVTLDVLTNESATIHLDDLAEAVAEREVNESVASEEGVEHVTISLHTNHLPKMKDFGVIDYDPEEQLVIRNPASDWSGGGTAMENRTTSAQSEYTAEMSDTDYHRLLAHGRRRTALEVLSELTPPVELEDLAALVVVQESSGLVSSDEQEASVAIALHHAHLPKMDELGIIEYNQDAGRVERGPL